MVAYINVQMEALIANQEKMLKNMNRIMKANLQVATVQDKLTESTENATEAAKKYNTKLGEIANFISGQGKGGLGKSFSFLRKVMISLGGGGIFIGLTRLSYLFETLDTAVGRVSNTFPSFGKAVKKSILGIDFSKFDELSEGVRGARGQFIKARDDQISTGDNKARVQSKLRNLRSAKKDRLMETLGIITGIRKSPLAERRAKLQERLNRIQTKATKMYTQVANLIKKYAIKAAIVFLASIFQILAVIVIAYLIFKAFGPQIMTALKAGFETFKKVGKVILGGLMIVWDGIKDVFGAFFGGGDLVQLIDGLLKIVGGLLLVAIGLVVTALSVLGVFIYKFVESSIARALQFFKDWRDGLIDGVTKVALIIATIAGVVAFIVSGAWAAMIAGAIAFYIAKKVGAFFGRKASGGMVTSPMTLVGERGPEMVSLPRGSTVSNASSSRKMGTGNVFNITINAKDTSKAEMRRIADEIGRMVSSKINRTTSSSTFR